jgi:hypothetical protein
MKITTFVDTALVLTSKWIAMILSGSKKKILRAFLLATPLMLHPRMSTCLPRPHPTSMVFPLPHCLAYYRTCGKVSSSRLGVAPDLRFPAAMTLIVTAEELDTSSVSHLLYLSVKLDRSSCLVQALVDGGSSINLIHESIVALLDIPTVPCIGPKVSLPDGKTTLPCKLFVVLDYTLTGIPRQDTIFVSSIGVQAMTLGMPWLEKVNPLIE